MFDRLKEAIKNLSQMKPQFDASVFNDPVALKTEWVPCKRGGTNFKTHSLNMKSPDRASFRASFGAWLFYSVFMLFGFSFMIAGIVMGINQADAETESILVFAGFGFLFGMIGVVLAFFGARPVVFDKMTGFYWKGFTQPNIYIQNPDSKNLASLKDIHALQIISEWVRGDKTSYTSYELNLVMKDGSRKNVIDHGNYKKLAKDAKQLSDFLEIPLWDKIAINN